jgi:mono/diheme cytochrome c family protein
MKQFVALIAAIYATTLLGIISAQPASSAKTSDGRQIFRFDTFGDEQLWTGVLQMHQAISSVSPAVALNVGLKVDVEALPPTVIDALSRKEVNLNDPAVTILLLSLNAVVGVIGKVDDAGQLTRVGITCALCHSTVDDSFADGIGKRLDLWPNRDLNVGAILGLSPALPDSLKAEFARWGPGKYDPRHHAFDGTNIIPLNSPSLPVLIPPAYGLKGVGFETYTGDGSISYWNSYVGVTQMGGQGSFTDLRPPINLTIIQKPDRLTPKLPALLDYQLSVPAPPPPSGSFDAAAARRGERLFSGKAQCATCHIPPTYTDVLSGPDPSVPFLHDPALHDPASAELSYAARSATGQYRTSPLRGIWQHPPYFHDGSAADLLAVVNHYDQRLGLNLSASQKADLVAFLKSL